MSSNSPPLPPKRTSSPDLLDFRVGELEKDVSRLDVGMKELGFKIDNVNGTLILEAAKTRAAASAEMTKMIVAALLTIATSIVGVIGVNKLQEKPPVKEVIERSAFDRALDTCRALPSGQAECVQRVIAESLGKP